MKKEGRRNETTERAETHRLRLIINNEDWRLTTEDR